MLPFSDPQPMHDVCGLSSCQGVHCGQDSACSGQDLWLLRTRCVSDEYFKCCSLKSYRAGQLSNSPVIYEVASFSRGNWIFFSSLWPIVLVSVIIVLCVCVCVNVLVWVCAFHAAFEATRFYNVSESSPLARELCDGPTCNEVESSTNQWIGETHATHWMIHGHPTFISVLKTLLSIRFCAGKPVQQCVWLPGGGAVWALHLLQRLRVRRRAGVWVRRTALPEPVSDGGVCLSERDTHQAGPPVPVSSE